MIGVTMSGGRLRVKTGKKYCKTTVSAQPIKIMNVENDQNGNITMIKIELLKQHSTAIPALAKMWHELLGKIWLPEVSIQRIETKFHDHLHDDTLPLTLVALDGQKPVGMCSLRENDGIRPDLTPWLGSLIVDQDNQGRGVGKLLIDATKNKAKEMGFKKLYLFAFDLTIPEYYHRHGWATIYQDVFKSYDVTVMMINL